MYTKTVNYQSIKKVDFTQPKTPLSFDPVIDESTCNSGSILLCIQYIFKDECLYLTSSGSNSM